MAIYQIRYIREKVSDALPAIITTPKSALDYFLAQCFAPDELWREKLYVLFVDSGRRACGHMLVSVGGLNDTSFDSRLVIKAALDSGAHAVVLAHNHPSGNPIPSQHDIQMTARFKNQLTVMGLTLLDHIVIGEDTFYSFVDETIQKID